MIQAHRRDGRSLLATMVMLACMAMWISAVYHTYMVVKFPNSTDANTSDAPAAPLETPTGAAAQDIVNANLFNIEVDANNEVASGGAGLPELHGTVAGSGKTPSYAIMAAPGEEEKSYKVGDVLPGGAEITKIEPDHIVVVLDKTQHMVYLRPKS